MPAVEIEPLVAAGIPTMTTEIQVAPANLVMKIPQPSEDEAMIAIVERMMRDPSVDLDRISKALELREKVVARKAEREFIIALNAAQAEMGPVRQDAANPQTRSKYATFLALDKVLRPVYTAHGFTLSFNTGDAKRENDVRVLLYLSHIGGHSKTYYIDMPADGIGAKGGAVMTRTHATGSAVTYGRRYTLCMAFNIAIGEADDDGNKAGGKAAPSDNGTVTEEQMQALHKRIEELSIPTKRFCDVMGIGDISEITAQLLVIANKKLDNQARHQRDAQ
jgi:hypothetical protein